MKRNLIELKHPEKSVFLTFRLSGYEFMSLHPFCLYAPIIIFYWAIKITDYKIYIIHQLVIILLRRSYTAIFCLILKHY